jgi:pyridinium-3,5-biscarboxylic acid mononucleotide synthase
MTPRRLKTLLARFRKGDINLSATLDALRGLPFEDLGDARIDHHRTLRRGMPEIVLGSGKTAEQIVRICRRMKAAGGPVVVSRLTLATMAEVRRALPDAQVHEVARLAVLGRTPPQRATGILVCCAGTSDMPVAEEAAVTLESLGHKVDRLRDVGVAGVHRLLKSREELDRASVIIAVAGMEGALPSVIAGLVRCPVIGVPTSIGYGTAFGGLAALLGMLNSCAGGLVVVNIDNGVGAALAAHLIVSRQGSPKRDGASRRRTTSGRRRAIAR